MLFSLRHISSMPTFHCPCTSIFLFFYCPRGFGLAIAVVLLLAFVERPSSLSISSDPRRHSPHWDPPCGVTESIELVCLLIFSLDLAVKVNTTTKIFIPNPLAIWLNWGFNMDNATCYFQTLISPFESISLCHAYLFYLLSSELLDWLGGIPKEQMADLLHSGHFSICH